MKEYKATRKCLVKPEKKDSNKKYTYIDVVIGVFFDGTNNNKYNIAYGKDKNHAKEVKEWQEKETHDSYTSDYTNIKYLWEAYYQNLSKYIGRVYIEGVGTYEPEKDGLSSGKDDSSMAGATGRDGFSNTGIDAKLKRAQNLIKESINKMVGEQENLRIKSLTLDFFGFSRGATTARSFINKIWYFYTLVTDIHGKPIYVPRRLYDILGIPYAVEINVRFLGLFDTVSSYGLNHKNDVDFLGLKIPTGFVRKTVHLVAADEYRSNFSLTNIASAGEKGTEIILPGAHSDIGGGYSKEEHEYLYMGEMPSGYELTYRPVFRGYMTFERLHNDKWINDYLYNYASDQYWRRNHSKAYNSPPPFRRVRNDYARIPLKIMYNLAKNQIPLFDQSLIMKKTTLTDPKLIELGQKLETMANNGKNIYKIGAESGIYYNADPKGPMRKLILSIRSKYLHLSAHNKTVMGFIRPHTAPFNHKRDIIQG
ncbi:DUF2235 domain-containing protein [Prevotella melaninogenica]|uniref:DUF2235 domain-containing protein n=1 Tax=Prevotella melaninogenica TaxID=28132 RepID=A0ABX7XSH0_9BACT|nr:DUF2235 domain-containing protein [Prevotella melaninogenica]QUB76648.1 DUF2235 domain-containing protein [Prevotella melaninogenica]